MKHEALTAWSENFLLQSEEPDDQNTLKMINKKSGQNDNKYLKKMNTFDELKFAAQRLNTFHVDLPLQLHQRSYPNSIPCYQRITLPS